MVKKRKFDGQIYEEHGEYSLKDKKIAQNYARTLRRKGWKVRVVNESGKYVLYRRWEKGTEKKRFPAKTRIFGGVRYTLNLYPYSTKKATTSRVAYLRSHGIKAKVIQAYGSWWIYMK